jgi:uncharacterized protein YcbX
MIVSGIFIYPIKATSAIAIPQAEVRPRGLAGDRRWVVVDENGKFLQQRVEPRLAQVHAVPAADGGLQVAAPGMSPLAIPVPGGDERIPVSVWNDTVDAARAATDASAWFSKFLGMACHLAFMDHTACRPVTSEHGGPADQVSFADTMPLLLTSEASLADLNRRLAAPLPMSRFRPNVVVHGADPWDEDHWKRVLIGEVELEATHPCRRCLVTTIDQQTGRKSPDGEPLKTLATFRRRNQGVDFGMNLVPRGAGVVRVGDEVTVVSR